MLFPVSTIQTQVESVKEIKEHLRVKMPIQDQIITWFTGGISPVKANRDNITETSNISLTLDNLNLFTNK